MLGIDGAPVFARLFRWPRQVRSTRSDTSIDLPPSNDGCSSIPGVFVTGSGFRAVGIPDCIADARQAATAAAEFTRARRVESGMRLFVWSCRFPACASLASLSHQRRRPRRRSRRDGEGARSIKAADKGQLAVSEEDGRFLRVLVAARSAKSVLEIGAASGYSGHLARPWRARNRRTRGCDRVRPAASEGSSVEYPRRRSGRRRRGRAATRSPRSRGCQARSTSCSSTRGSRLQEVLRPGVPAPDARRRVRGAQRRQQEETRWSDFLGTILTIPAVHDDRVAVARRYVGVLQNEVKPVHIIGVPLDLGAGRRGVDMGPSAFRIAGIGDQIAALGCTVVDKGDLPSRRSRKRSVPDDARKKYVAK